MGNIPAVVINYRREIIPAPTLDFEIGKIGLPYLRQSSAMLCSPRIPSITIKTFCSEVKIRFVLRRISFKKDSDVLCWESAERFFFVVIVQIYFFIDIIHTKIPNLIEVPVVHFCLTTYSIFRARGENQKDKRNNKAKINQQKNFR